MALETEAEIEEYDASLLDYINSDIDGDLIYFTLTGLRHCDELNVYDIHASVENMFVRNSFVDRTTEAYWEKYIAGIDVAENTRMGIGEYCNCNAQYIELIVIDNYQIDVVHAMEVEWVDRFMQELYERILFSFLEDDRIYSAFAMVMDHYAEVEQYIPSGGFGFIMTDFSKNSAYMKLVEMVEELENKSVRSYLYNANGELKTEEEIEDFLHFMFSLPHAEETLRTIGYGDYVDLYEDVFGPMG